MRWLWAAAAAVILVVILVVAGLESAKSAERTFNVDRYCPSAWDDTFRSATRLFMPTALKGQWLRVKATALVESSCRPNVCSHAGACGVLQLMRGTWQDQMRAYGQSGSVFEPKLNIILGVRYLGWLCGQFARRGRGADEIHPLCGASYNTGIGHVLHGQALCDDARLWPGIVPCMRRVISESSFQEVTNYVQRIDRWYAKLRR